MRVHGGPFKGARMVVREAVLGGTRCRREARDLLGPGKRPAAGEHRGLGLAHAEKSLAMTHGKGSG